MALWIEHTSLSEQLATAQRFGWARHDENAVACDRQARGELGSREYYGAHSAESVARLLADPPRDIVDAIELFRAELAERIALPTRARRRMVRGLECGDELSADAWITRRDDGWSEIRRERAPVTNAAIAVNVATAWNMSREALLWRGAAAAALADVLSERGVNVRIEALASVRGFSSADGGGLTISRTVVKDSDEPLSLASVAVALADLSWFRMVSMPADARSLPSGPISGNWGAVAPVPPEMSGADFLIDSDCTTRDRAAAWLAAAATKDFAECA